MLVISRRDFIQKSAAAAALIGAGTRLLEANPLGFPIGCQTYPVRKMIAKDFPGTIKVLKAAGFENIELCSPVGYADAGFGGLAKYKGAELRSMIADLGVKCESSHFDINELRKDQAGRIEWANEMGLKQMIVPSLDGPKNPTMDDVKRAAEEYNKMGEHAAKAGIQQGLHNEDFELTTVDGKRTYDILLELLHPKLVKFQFQCSTFSQGYDPVAYFKKYPGHFMSMHVQDWSSQTKKIVAVGQGSLDWKQIFAAAKPAGVKNYFVEMNLDLMRASVPYLRKLEVA